MKLIIPIILSILSTSCNSQEKKVNHNIKSDSDKVEIESQIGEYVTSVFEDSQRKFMVLEQMEMELQGMTVKI
ncbi:MAG: hypothetical protein IPG18_12235 [Saprospiraceae bacterium]|nr:hypothetical protein [Saprospiraceae bacterium]